MLTVFLFNSNDILIENKENIKIVKVDNEISDLSELIKDVDTKYVQFVFNEIVYNLDWIEKITNKEGHIFIGSNITNISEYIFDVKKLKDMSYSTKNTYYEKLFLIAYARSHMQSEKLISQSDFISEYDINDFKLSYEKNWYDDFFEFYDKISKDDELALYLMIAMFIHNMNHRQKHLVDAKAFCEKCSEILQDISDDYIDEFLNENLDLYGGLVEIKYVLYKIKYSDKYEDIKKKLFEDEKKEVEVELIEYKNDNLVFECSLCGVYTKNICDISIRVKDNKEKIVAINEKERFSDLNFFGETFYSKRTFSFEIKKELLNHNTKIEVLIERNDTTYVCKMFTKRFVSKISSNVKNAYYIFDKKKAIEFVNDCKQIRVFKIGFFKHLKKEFSLLLSMAYGDNHSISMIIMRLLYWLTRPYFCKKNIWITFDKPFKAGDCGEYIYKYVRDNGKGVDIRYVINGKYNDALRLKNEGYAPLIFGTLKQRLFYLNASIILTTHGVIHNYNAFNNRQIVFVQDLIFAHAMCIQHGLSVQELAFEENRVYNNIKRYYCASKYEIMNLSKKQYDYNEENLKLTGIPRYDGLKDKKEKMILIAPTWRQYIVTPSKVGETRPYFESFKDMDYFKIYDKLLRSDKLISFAKSKGYSIKFILHPIITNQKKDFTGYDDCIEIIAAIDANYEELLTKASLLVTDYSGIQFDFAYMRKPLLYYHPSKLPPHYKEGGFFYDTMAFGEICNNNDDIVNMICEYIKEDIKIKDFYKKREDDFFAYSDYDNCKRIYEDVCKYQNNNM